MPPEDRHESIPVARIGPDIYVRGRSPYYFFSCEPGKIRESVIYVQVNAIDQSVDVY